MKATLFALTGLFCVPFLVSPSFPTDSGEYKIDAGHSSIIFGIKHANAGNFRGRFNEFEGNLNIDEEKLENSSVEISINANSVDTANEKRDQHLRSPDFFNVKQFPKIIFKSTKVKLAGEGKYEISGDLTFHGVTKSVTANATKIGAAKDRGVYRIGYDVTFKISRSEFGVKYMPEGLGDDVHLLLGIEGVRQGKE